MNAYYNNIVCSFSFQCWYSSATLQYDSIWFQNFEMINYTWHVICINYYEVKCCLCFESYSIGLCDSFSFMVYWKLWSLKHPEWQESSMNFFPMCWSLDHNFECRLVFPNHFWNCVVSNILGSLSVFHCPYPSKVSSHIPSVWVSSLPWSFHLPRSLNFLFLVEFPVFLACNPLGTGP